ncbi:quinone-dependent dihydroorotate dehydrogenase [Bartonella tamiae]|uniref:Dihydroorotate dehydrogenase (quinone) n=1 Tax=Bartonella tamiae Th239 TaxID=1094558 RepID=J1JWP7_9HYPH|nr:quinone-dependent dihydroorotate dehydrogenase [Bartonella tamiae]EJF89402.1 dihydroorotate oxidase [Bartonella tamiae Th239]EJF92733.1 dihydroorotate oxidase [Bartonella tamiae Th307]
MSFFKKILRPFLFSLDAERAHKLAISALKVGIGFKQNNHLPDLSVNIAGLTFPNFLGLGAGFDKNGEVANALLNLGFGFVEVGTLTPKAQAGNAKPRLFRLNEDEGVINRMGFNNDGHDIIYQRLMSHKRHHIIGVNIGANKDSHDRVADYVCGIHKFYDVADYFTVNISSPNTPGLRDLQARDSLKELLTAISTARLLEKEKFRKQIPIFLKIAPDLTQQALDDIAQELLSSDFDGVIVSNTTLSRKGLKNQNLAHETGGLSGKPLFERSTIILAKMRKILGKTMPIIGVGGVHDADTALEKIKAGADLVQLYSAMVYQGPLLASMILKSIEQKMKEDGVKRIADYRDHSLDEWAKRSIPL